ncbi:Holliday junction branch migration DNA helicase RuvB, partial [Patescibacteria group bacterium]|nr:Holliday junction branch migration DNA helicase RuvB [Patescibacteria group bacterium]
ARTMRINLPKFTLIGATTKAAMLSSPLRDRFGSVIKLDFYTTEDIEQIIKRSSRILNIKVSDGASVALAKCCRKTPRIANRLLKRARDFASVDDREIICDEIAMITLKSLGIDNLGLDKTDRFLLKTIFEKFSGGPVGLNTLAAAIIEDEATIEEVFEPYLIQLGFLERTPRGRKITMQGIEHIGHSSKIQLL